MGSMINPFEDNKQSEWMRYLRQTQNGERMSGDGKNGKDRERYLGGKSLDAGNPVDGFKNFASMIVFSFTVVRKSVRKRLAYDIDSLSIFDVPHVGRASSTPKGDMHDYNLGNSAQTGSKGRRIGYRTKRAKQINNRTTFHRALY